MELCYSTSLQANQEISDTRLGFATIKLYCDGEYHECEERGYDKSEAVVDGKSR